MQSRDRYTYKQTWEEKAYKETKQKKKIEKNSIEISTYMNKTKTEQTNEQKNK